MINIVHSLPTLPDASHALLVILASYAALNAATRIRVMPAVFFEQGGVTTLPSTSIISNTLPTPMLIAITTVFCALALLTLAFVLRNWRTKKQLNENENSWRFTLEDTGDGLWDWNLQTDEASFSKRGKEMLGYSEHDFPNTGTIWLEYIHPEDKGRVLSAVHEYCVEASSSLVVEYRIRCKDGVWKRLLLRGKLISRDAKQNPLRMICLHTDISTCERSKKSIQHVDSKFRSLYDSSSDAVMLLDENGFFDCNKAALELFGYATVEEFCTKHPADLSPPEQPCGTSSRVLANHRIATAVKKGNLCFEWVHKRAENNENFPAEVLLSAINLDGKPVIQATVRDITEYKQTTTKPYVATSVESQEGLIVTDADKVILRVNDVFTRLTGYTAEEVIGKKPSILQSGLQNTEFYASMWVSINNTGNWEGEIWNRRKNGEIFPGQLVISALKDMDGKVTNYIATFIDITRNKAAAEIHHARGFLSPPSPV